MRLIARNNEVLATRKTDADGTRAFEPGLARGEGGSAPALLVAAVARRRLRLPQSQRHRPSI